MADHLYLTSAEPLADAYMLWGLANQLLSSYFSEWSPG